MDATASLSPTRSDALLRMYLEHVPEEPAAVQELSDDEYRAHYPHNATIMTSLLAMTLAAMVFATAGDGSVLKPVSAAVALVLLLIAATRDISGRTAANDTLRARHRADRAAWQHELRVQAAIRAAYAEADPVAAHRAATKVIDLFHSSGQVRLRRWVRDHPLSEFTEQTLNWVADDLKTRLGL